MTEWWVSQKKHFCEYCKVWTGGHLWQIRKHEEGRMHQEKKELYLKNCRIREKDRQREEQDLKRQLAEIEKAAEAAVARDAMREMEGLEPEPPDETPPPSASRPPRVVGGPGGGFGPMFPGEPVLSVDQQKAAIQQAVAAAQKRKAEEERAQAAAAAGSDPANLQPKAPVPAAEGSPWLICSDPKSGKEYFYNKVTKVSSWKRPPELGPDPNAPAPPGPPGGPPGPPPRKPPPPPAKPQSVGQWQVVLPEESMWANHAEIAAARQMERAQALLEASAAAGAADDEAPYNPLADLKTEVSGRKGQIADEDVEKHEKVMEQKRSLTSGNASFPVKRTKASGIRKKKADDDE